MEKTQRNRPSQQEAFLEKYYESQLEKILEQIEEYNHPMRCRILEQLLIRSQFSQIQLLWTVLQPVCHRDFMYTARMAFPEFQLSPISTEFSRRLSKWFKGGRMGRLFRVPSVFLRDLDDVRRFTSNGQHTQEQTERLGTGPVKEHEEQRIRLPKLCSQKDFLKNRSEPQLDALPCCEDLRLVQRTFMRSQEMIFLKKGKKVLPQRRVSPKPGQIIEMYEHQWNDAQRNHLLKKLLLLLDLRQHYYILTFLTVKCYRDFIGLLPKKLSLKILSFLSPRELLLTSQSKMLQQLPYHTASTIQSAFQQVKVCKTWYKRCGSNRLWQIKCKESTVGIPVIEQVESWKRVFKNDYCLRQNWERGNCYTVELKGHTAVVCCVAVCDKYVASGSKDKTICVWLLHNGNHVQTLEGHRKGVWGLQFFTENLLVSSSYDSSIKIWNIRLGGCVRTLTAHSGPVWSIVLRSNILLSGSQDKTANVWDLRHCKLLQTLVGHTKAIFAVDQDLETKKSFTGSADKSIRIWDWTSGNCLKVLWPSVEAEGPLDIITGLSYDRGFLACSASTTVWLYSTETGKCLHMFEPHKKRIEAVQLRMIQPYEVKGVLMSAAQDGLLKYWDLSDYQSNVQTLKGHSSAVKCLVFDEERIISGSQDNTIRIWNLIVYYTHFHFALDH